MASASAADCVVLRLLLRYRLQLMPGVETRPSLDIWLTRNISNQLAVVQLAEPDPVTGVASGAIEIAVSFALLPVRTATTYAVPRTTIVASTPGSAATTTTTASMSASRQPAGAVAETAFPGVPPLATRIAAAAAATQIVSAAAAVPLSQTGLVRAGREASEMQRTVQAALDAIGAGCLNVDAFVQMRNEHGEVCRNQSGASRVWLGDLFGLGKDRSGELATNLLLPMFNKAITFDLEPATPYDPKGMLVFDRARCSLHYDGVPVADASIVAPALWRAPQHVASPVEAYIRETETRFTTPNLRSTWSTMDRVNIFRYVSRVGVLPSAGFVNAPRGQTGEAFFANAAKLALRRMGVSEADALAWKLGPGPDANPTHCRLGAYYVAQLLSMYLQYCDYIVDQVCVRETATRKWGECVEHAGPWQWKDRMTGQLMERPEGPVEIEYFYHVRLRFGAFDCEDGSCEFMVESAELDALETTRVPLLVLARRIKANFVLCMLLAGVSQKEINLTEPTSKLEAHMNAALINKNHMTAWTGRALRCAHRPSDAEIAAAKHYPPIVMLESTGVLDPNGVEHADADADGEKAMTEALSSSKLVREQARPIFHYSSQPEASASALSFYKTVRVLMTDEFMKRGCGLSSWVLLDRARKTAGVTFQDVAAARLDRVEAVPYDELTPEQLAVMERYALDLHPMPSLEPPSETDVPPHIVRARQQMAELQTALRALADRNAAVASPPSGHTGVRVLKYHSFDEARVFYTQLLQCLSASRTPVVGYTLLEEHVTHDRGGFVLTIMWGGGSGGGGARRGK